MAINVSSVGFGYPGSDKLFSEVSFKVDTGMAAALIGDNGVGKSTLLRIIAEELRAKDGSVVVDGSIRLMTQAIGLVSDGLTVRDFLCSLATEAEQAAANELWASEAANELEATEASGMRLAFAIASWVDVDGYTLEASWDAACSRVLDQNLNEVGERPASSLSGGERKRMALEVLFAADIDVLLLDEPDNFLDIPGKRWLERRIRESRRTVLVISHDRELLSNAMDRIITVEAAGAWTHGRSFADYPAARESRNKRLGKDLTRWKTEERRLYHYYKLLKQRAAISEAMAARADAAQSRWERFVAEGPPPAPPSQSRVSMNLAGSDSGRRVLRCVDLELTDLTLPFSFDVYLGERVAIVGANGTGKSHFMRLLGGEDVASTGTFTIGSRVQPGMFVQTNEREGITDRNAGDSIRQLAGTEEAMMSALARYGLHGTASQPFATLSGGQQARLQILALELEGVNLLLLDEPTDNLDLISAEALQSALERFTGTVLAVTHDRWFLRGLDRFIIFDRDGAVTEAGDYEAALKVLSEVEDPQFRPGDLRPLTNR